MPARHPPFRRFTGRRVALGGLALLAACARSPAPSPPPGAVDPCALEASLNAAPDTTPLTIILSEPLRPPSPSRAPNRSEAIVFRHLYEPLVRLDCEGRPVGALAEAWRREANGARWRLTLRREAEFGDGRPVTAETVVSWMTGGGHPTGWIETLGLESARADGAHDLLLTFAAPGATLPLALADPALAPMTPRDDQWPAGTGPYRVVGAEGASTGTAARLPGIVAVPVSGRGRAIVFRQAADDDLRDALHEGADLLVARDPEVRGYATTLADFIVASLPWDRVYVLAVPLSSSMSVPEIPEGIRVGLARDAVRADARASSDVYWWEERGDCAGAVAAVPERHGPRGPRRIVFRGEDPVSRALAERLVAVAAANSDGAEAVRALVGNPTVVVHGLADEAFADVVASGAEAGYVLSLPRRAYDRCLAVFGLRQSLPWLDRAGARLVPLVETRAYVAMRRGAGRFLVEWDGVPVVSARP